MYLFPNLWPYESGNIAIGATSRHSHFLIVIYLIGISCCKYLRPCQQTLGNNFEMCSTLSLMSPRWSASSQCLVETCSCVLSDSHAIMPLLIFLELPLRLMTYVCVLDLKFVSVRN